MAHLNFIFPVLIGLLSCCLHLQAQSQSLRIVKDNLACTYGLKNQEGQWVVEPTYTRMEQMQTGHYEVTAGFSRGLLDSEGTILFPPEYDDFNRMSDSLLEVTRDRKKGIVSFEGALLTPIEFYQIYPEVGGNFLGFRGEYNRTWTTYFDQNATVLIPEMEGRIQPFGRDSLTVITGTWDNNSQRILGAGVINRKGRMVLERRYDQVSICGPDRFSVQNDLKVGVVDRAGTELVPVKYYVELVNGRNGHGPPCLVGEDLVRIRDLETNQVGLMTGEGEVVALPQYKWIEWARYGDDTELYAYRIFNEEGKQGTLDQAGKTVIPAIYDTLIPQQSFPIPGNPEPQKGLYFVALKEGRYGMLDDSGGTVIPFEQDGYLNSYHNGYHCVYFFKGFQIQCCNIDIPKTQGRTLELLVQEGTERIYINDESLIPFSIHPDNPKHLQVKHNEFYYSQKFGELVVVPVGGRQLFFTEDWKPWGDGKFQWLNSNGFPHMTLWTHTGKCALVDKKSGQLLTDTLFGMIDQNLRSPGFMWGQEVGRKQPSSPNCGYWRLLNEKGEPITEEVFDYPFLAKDSAVAISGGYLGLYDTKSLSWKIEPRFGLMWPVDDELWFVISRQGKMGLVRHTGEMLADTVYDRIDEVYSNYYWIINQPVRQSEPGPKEKWWKVTQGDTHYLLNLESEMITDSLEVYNQLREFAFAKLESPPFNNCRGCIELQPSIHNLKPRFESSLAEPLFNLVSELHDAHPTCPMMIYGQVPCTRMDYRCNNQGDARFFQVDFLTNEAFSLREGYVSPNRNWGFDEMGTFIEHNWHNALLVGDTLQFFTLTDVFGSLEVVEAELIHAIRSRDDLDLDCSSPEGLVNQLQGHFSFSEKGIILYLRQSNSFIDYIEFLIPWRRLEQQASSKWLADRFLK